MTPAKGQEPGPGTLTQAQQRRADQRAVDQDRTLAAMHQLEAALAAAAPRREQAWLSEVRQVQCTTTAAAHVPGGRPV